jgi:hypothetical protein
MMLNSQTTNSVQILVLVPLLDTSKNPLANKLLSSLSKALPCFQPTFAKRTCGQCLGACSQVQISVSPPLLIINVVILIASLLCLLPFSQFQPGFDMRPVHMRFWWKGTQWDRFFFEYFGLPFPYHSTNVPF